MENNGIKTPNTSFEERKPILEVKIDKSKDGKWMIFKTIRTDIIHVNYLDKILNKGD